MAHPAFQRLSTGRRTAALVALLGTIFAADLVAGADLTLRALYILPVGLAAWMVGRRAAFVLCGLSILLCVYFDVLSGMAHIKPAFVYSDAAVRLLVYVTAVAVVGRLRDAQRRLADEARSDALTGLYNRRGFDELGRRELERARRNAAPLTLVGLDLDGFKKVNDTRGHAEGDKVLVSVARILDSGRATDVVARIGGDEFALLLTDADAASTARAVDRIHTSLREAITAGGWNVGFSVGVARYRTPPASVDEMLAAADALMYQVKRGAKGTVLHADMPTSEDSAREDREPADEAHL